MAFPLRSRLYDFLSESDFQEYASFIQDCTGIEFKIDKKNLIEYRIAKRILDKGLDSKNYLTLVKSSPEELKIFINQITTHKTEWFREREHFDFLAQQFSDTQKPIYVWSAACSTGEEPFSIMMALGESGLGAKYQRILATDISGVCVEHARQAIYPLSVIEEALPKNLISKYFVLPPYSTVHHSAYAIVNPNWAESIVKFKELNLVEFSLPNGIYFDVIFIRNVLIYFEMPMILQILRNVLRYLRPKGFLILGLTEPLQRPQELGLRRINNSIYRYG